MMGRVNLRNCKLCGRKLKKYQHLCTYCRIVKKRSQKERRQLETMMALTLRDRHKQFIFKLMDAIVDEQNKVK